MSQTTTAAYTHPAFQDVLNYLIECRFRADIGIEEDSAYDIEGIKKACWLASIISSSEDDNEKYAAATFAKLLFLKYPKDALFMQSAYIILSRTGNLIATNFLKELYENPKENELKFKVGFGALLDIELGAKRTMNQLNVLGQKYATTDFQLGLWKALHKDGNVSISAPTSAGKSFLIQNYLLEKFITQEKFLALYIVPSRALISQVNDSFRRTLPEEVSIQTAFIKNEESPHESLSNKELLIITPERCLRLLQFSSNYTVEPDFIFIDEIQNVENEDNRGFLYEHVLQEIIESWPEAKIVTAGPFIGNAKQLYNSLFEREATQASTILSPVYQLRTTVRPDSQNPESVLFKLKLSNNQETTISIPVGFNYNEVAKTKKGAVAKLVSEFGKGSQNIVYVPRTDYAEEHALLLAKEIGENGTIEIQSETSELIDLIKEEIHADYYLINCLQSGVCFHHSKIPDIIRSEIEYLFGKKKLRNIVCTATLLEGVNLPAEKIFIPFAKKETKPLSLFEFGNLIGRAGRISTNLYGSIYCIEKEDENWTQDYSQENYQKEIVPAAEKVLNTAIGEVFRELNGNENFVSNRAEYAVSFLKHGFLKDRAKFRDYLQKKNLSEAHQTELFNQLEEKLQNIEIPISVLKSNPNIDPEKQDALYKRVREDGIEKWVLHYHDKFHSIMSRANRESRTYQAKNMFGQLESIFFRLDEYFELSKEAYFKHNISRSVPQMALNAYKWLQNASYSQLIASDIHFFSIHFNTAKRLDKEDKDAVNEKINEVIKVYSTVVSFILVKYLKLLVDILENLMTPEQKEEFSFTLSMPTMLELGTTKTVVLGLISGGMPRSIAVKIYQLIPEEFQDRPLEWLKTKETINTKPVYVNFLKRKGFLKDS